jgi:hypothetical protein
MSPRWRPRRARGAPRVVPTTVQTRDETKAYMHKLMGQLANLRGRSAIEDPSAAPDVPLPPMADDQPPRAAPPAVVSKAPACLMAWEKRVKITMV